MGEKQLFNSCFLSFSHAGIIEVLDNKNKIVALKYSNNIIKKNDLVDYKGYNGESFSDTIIGIIRGEQEQEYLLQINSKNFVYRFTLPFYFKFSKDSKHQTHLVNSYIDPGKQSIYFQYHFDEEVDEAFTSSKYHHECWKIGEYYLYEMKIPNEWNKDWELLVQGNYSKLSEKCKNRFLSFIANNNSTFKVNTDPLVTFPDSTIISSDPVLCRFNRIFKKDDMLRQRMSMNLGVDIPTHQELHSKFQNEHFIEFTR